MDDVNASSNSNSSHDGRDSMDKAQRDSPSSSVRKEQEESDDTEKEKDEMIIENDKMKIQDETKGIDTESVSDIDDDNENDNSNNRADISVREDHEIASDSIVNSNDHVDGNQTSNQQSSSSLAAAATATTKEPEQGYNQETNTNEDSYNEEEEGDDDQNHVIEKDTINEDIAKESRPITPLGQYKLDESEDPSSTLKHANSAENNSNNNNDNRRIIINTAKDRENLLQLVQDRNRDANLRMDIMKFQDYEIIIVFIILTYIFSGVYVIVTLIYLNGLEDDEAKWESVLSKEKYVHGSLGIRFMFAGLSSLILLVFPLRIFGRMIYKRMSKRFNPSQRRLKSDVTHEQIIVLLLVIFIWMNPTINPVIAALEWYRYEMIENQNITAVDVQYQPEPMVRYIIVANSFLVSMAIYSTLYLIKWFRLGTPLSKYATLVTSENIGVAAEFEVSAFGSTRTPNSPTVKDNIPTSTANEIAAASEAFLVIEKEAAYVRWVSGMIPRMSILYFVSRVVLEQVFFFDIGYVPCVAWISTAILCASPSPSYKGNEEYFCNIQYRTNGIRYALARLILACIFSAWEICFVVWIILEAKRTRKILGASPLLVSRPQQIGFFITLTVIGLSWLGLIAIGAVLISALPLASHLYPFGNETLVLTGVQSYDSGLSALLITYIYCICWCFLPYQANGFIGWFVDTSIRYDDYFWGAYKRVNYYLDSFTNDANPNASSKDSSSGAQPVSEGAVAISIVNHTSKKKGNDESEKNFILSECILDWNLSILTYHAGNTKYPQQNMSLQMLVDDPTLLVIDQITDAETGACCVIIKSQKGFILAFRGILEHESNAAPAHTSPYFSASELKFISFDDITKTNESATNDDKKDSKQSSHMLVHEGLYKGYKSIRNLIFDSLKKHIKAFADEQQQQQQGKVSIHFNLTGFAVGGAMATLCALDLSEHALISQLYDSASVSVDDVLVFTFGTPRFCDSRFRKVYNTRIRKHFNVAVVGDEYTELPKRFHARVPLGYKHVGVHIAVDSKGFIVLHPDPIEMEIMRSQPANRATFVSHAMTTYTLSLLRWCSHVYSSSFTTLWKVTLHELKLNVPSKILDSLEVKQYLQASCVGHGPYQDGPRILFRMLKVANVQVKKCYCIVSCGSPGVHGSRWEVHKTNVVAAQRRREGVRIITTSDQIEQNPYVTPSKQDGNEVAREESRQLETISSHAITTQDTGNGMATSSGNFSNDMMRISSRQAESIDVFPTSPEPPKQKVQSSLSPYKKKIESERKKPELERMRSYAGTRATTPRNEKPPLFVFWGDDELPIVFGERQTLRACDYIIVTIVDDLMDGQALRPVGYAEIPLIKILPIPNDPKELRFPVHNFNKAGGMQGEITVEISCTANIPNTESQSSLSPASLSMIEATRIAQFGNNSAAIDAPSITNNNHHHSHAASHGNDKDLVISVDNSNSAAHQNTSSSRSPSSQAAEHGDMNSINKYGVYQNRKNAPDPIKAVKFSKEMTEFHSKHNSDPRDIHIILKVNVMRASLSDSTILSEIQKGKAISLMHCEVSMEAASLLGETRSIFPAPNANNPLPRDFLTATWNQAFYFGKDYLLSGFEDLSIVVKASVGPEGDDGMFSTNLASTYSDEIVLGTTKISMSTILSNYGNEPLVKWLPLEPILNIPNDGLSEDFGHICVVFEVTTDYFQESFFEAVQAAEMEKQKFNLENGSEKPRLGSSPDLLARMGLGNQQNSLLMRSSSSSEISNRSIKGSMRESDLSSEDLAAGGGTGIGVSASTNEGIKMARAESADMKIVSGIKRSPQHGYVYRRRLEPSGCHRELIDLAGDNRDLRKFVFLIAIRGIRKKKKADDENNSNEHHQEGKSSSSSFGSLNQRQQDLYCVIELIDPKSKSGYIKKTAIVRAGAYQHEWDEVFVFGKEKESPVCGNEILALKLMNWNRTSSLAKENIIGTYQNSKPVVDRNDPNFEIGKRYTEWIDISQDVDINIETKVFEFKRNE